MKIKIDPKADAAYVLVMDAPVARTQPKNDQIIVDYDEKGAIRGVELLDIGDGVDLGDFLPHELRVALEPLLAEHHIQTLV